MAHVYLSSRADKRSQSHAKVGSAGYARVSWNSEMSDMRPKLKVIIIER